MTAAELRALIAGAEELPPYTVSPTARPEQSLLVRGDSYRASTQLPTGVANLIAGVVNHAERFAELLAAEEAKAEPKREWTSCRPCDGWDYRVDGVYAGQVWPSSSGEWWWCLRDNLDNGIEPTQLLARAAVEAAVRAGR